MVTIINSNRLGEKKKVFLKNLDEKKHTHHLIILILQKNYYYFNKNIDFFSLYFFRRVVK